ncbi:ATP-binding protein [Mycobacterium riyadhense]|uniref:ATP-binding protein n=1 Tax=Mycobacterium riyadhense TaxID=486698 RepID=A0A1X2C6M1_9MYCO|nr:ATP-binding protein [Mycobacterium riyadhense]MCV7144585.1 ATP-binding protein [Mycobacterium riyadhense]ORW71540.1 hypothetical protein AWC22_01490 [Mycobacterium riyadhense]VTO98584.1 hypothetical protein BIN_B_02622 [Mycobacterium riyadhense]
MLIDRPDAATRLRRALDRAPVVLLTGPRQAGKTTLSRLVGQSPPECTFDAENPVDAARLADPMLALSGLSGLITIDEAQRIPDLFPVVRVLVDRPGMSARFLILGSASPDLVGLASESLAGRVELVELSGLTVRDVGASAADRLWLRGGLPPSFTARSDEDSAAWRDGYITTFLERDLAQLGVRIPAATMRRAWTMLAHFHAQLWNGAELARSLDVAQTTARRYLDALTDALVVRQLTPWFANIEKRQRRSPKIYIRDTGLLHRLLGIDDRLSLERNPKLGASWEGFVIEQLAALLAPSPLYFWRTQQDAELDLYVELSGRPYGFEIKRTSAPSLTRSMRSALVDLQLARLAIVYPGQHRFPLSDKVVAVPADHLLTTRSVDEVLALLK